MSKKTCPISRKDFAKHAKALKANIDGQDVLIPVKQFSTGSFGFYGTGKILTVINGEPVQLQMGITLTAVGSKELPPDAE